VGCSGMIGDSGTDSKSGAENVRLCSKLEEAERGLGEKKGVCCADLDKALSVYSDNRRSVPNQI
jgi:hypothetical protein